MGMDLTYTVHFRNGETIGETFVRGRHLQLYLDYMKERIPSWDYGKAYTLDNKDDIAYFAYVASRTYTVRPHVDEDTGFTELVSDAIPYYDVTPAFILPILQNNEWNNLAQKQMSLMFDHYAQAFNKGQVLYGKPLRNIDSIAFFIEL